METLSLANNDKMPLLGLGTWKSEPGEVYDAVLHALKTGYRHIDCAPIYGNEKEVGKAIAKAINEGIVDREELWITSKLWNNAHRKDQVKPALKKTLNDLQLDYLDLYLIHWPVVIKEDLDFPEEGDDMISLDEVPLTETWEGMEAVLGDDLTKHIGVSNFHEGHIESILENCENPPEMNQVELHPFNQQQELVNFCHENDIHVTAYSPLGSMDRPERLKQEDEPILLEHSVIKSIANKHDASPAQILIRWAVERETVVIPKSVSEDHIEQNYKALSISLDQDDMDKIEKLDLDFRYVDGTFWTQGSSPYTLEDLWGE